MTTHTLATRAALAIEAGPGAGPALLTRLTGRAVPYNTPTDIGSFTETIAPGAFAASLRAEPNLPLHLFHGDAPGQSPATPWPIGVATAWDDRRDGLYATWQLATTPEAQQAARLVRDGILRGLSVRFQPIPGGTLHAIRNGRDHLTQTRARLVSVSLTSIPAYVGALVTDVRSTTTTTADLAATDKVRTLAMDLGNPLINAAITGTARDMSAACDLVWTAIEVEGATAAPAQLDHLAASIYDTRPGLAVNLVRAAQCIHRDRVSEQLRRAHIDYYRRGLPPATDNAPAPRRRRRR